ncbi:uncharacterized protein LAESUDRAFT_693532 [Laetiporus sulphureus 93-53]|uniref:Succinate dehydrogenase assembly factor 4, mitochondrial n=1 Tax=Laetiporus sulphureus 93-53 TaxID=1314785 RepID=A0A165GZ02_9APHY|nr:uncharacterized protein LAESUDRAFT_693532 [Laetiporus sulphureus 93-53]KZT11020.1 hypothetical protein LAESUDRAFT_693532 [Laetiporus sulphureus 93-53]
MRNALSLSRMVPSRQNLPAIAFQARFYSSRDPLNRPSPPPLPREAQREFEELVRAAETPLAQPSRANPAEMREAQLALHPDAPKPIEPEFEGETNPVTGEHGGPKREPVGRWGEDEGDWSFKGRVTDF